jgi:hypothetical protein
VSSILTTPEQLLAQQLTQGITQAEGSGAPGEVPTIANNPGNLELGDIGYGATQAQGGNLITNFPSLEAGEQALQNQVESIITGSSANYDTSMSPEDISAIYTGADNPAWAQTVANAVGISPSTPLNQAPALASTPTLTPSVSLNDALASIANGPLAGGSAAPLNQPSVTNQGGTSIYEAESGVSSWIGARGAYFILGLLMIAAGVFSFRTSQVIVQTVGRAARSAAEAGAE